MFDRVTLCKAMAVFHNIFVGAPFVYFFIFLLNDTRYDIYFLLFLLVIRAHWFLLKGECIFTYIEKKILNPDYVLGSDIYFVPSHIITGKGFIDKRLEMFSSENFANLIDNIFVVIILYRNIKSPNFNLMLVISLITILIQICWNKITGEYYARLRKKYAKKNIDKIPLSKTKLS